MLNIIKSVYKKNRVSMLRAYPISFILQRVLSSIFALLTPVLLYYFVFNGKTENEFTDGTSGMNYLLFVSLGYGAYAVSIATLMNVGRSLISEIREGTIDSFLISPASRLGYFLGTFVEQLGRSFIEFFLVIVFSVFLGVKYNFENVIGMFLSVFLIAMVSFSMALILSNIMVYTRDTFISQNTLFIILSFLSGVSFPVTYLPKQLQFFSNLIPLTHALNVLRDVLTGNMGKSTVFSSILAIIEGLAIFYLGYIWFEKLEKKLIEEVFS
ncbi:ABC transporter permease [Streptococcus orisasini]